MSRHVVRPGDCLASIAAQHGFKDEAPLADDPANQALSDTRPSAAILHPGDVVSIPERRPKTVQLAAEAAHTITITRAKRHVEVRLLDEHGVPLASLPFTADDGTRLYAGDTDAEGWLKLDLPMPASELEVDVEGEAYRFDLGHLNPLEAQTDDAGASGAQGRLQALGIDAGRVDGTLGPRSRAALAAFQREHDLGVTGELDGDTRAALMHEHGA